MNALLKDTQLSEVVDLMLEEKRKLEAGEVTVNHAKAVAELGKAIVKFMRLQTK